MTAGKILKPIAAIVLLAYCGVVIFFYLNQQSLLYNPWDRVPDPVTADLPVEVTSVTTQDGLDLLAWYHAGDTTKPHILYTHGNAGDLESQAVLMKPLMAAGYSVLMVEYRGFGGNPGAPTEAGLYMDARAGLAWLAHRGVALSDTVLYGRSLGTGVMVQMASEVAAKGLILQAPFLSIPKAGGDHYPILPTNWLVHDRFDSEHKIASIGEPLFIYWGSSDHTGLPYQPAALLELAKGNKQKHIIDGADHSDLFTIGGNDDVLEFLSGL